MFDSDQQPKNQWEVPMAMNCTPIKVSCGMNICFVGVVTVIAPFMVHNNYVLSLLATG